MTIEYKYDSLPLFWKGMDPAEKKAAVESFDNHGVWNVPWIREVHHSFNIETKDLKNLRVCINLALDKTEHFELVGQYKNRHIYNVDVCENSHKYANKRLYSFQLVQKRTEN